MRVAANTCRSLSNCPSWQCDSPLRTAAQAEEALRYFAAQVNTEGYFWLHNVVPGRYWMLAQPVPIILDKR